MSFYNELNGFNPACVFFLPMLGKKVYEYPRFRDCFLSDDYKNIIIYTRCGGGNRNCGMGETDLYSMPEFITTYDDEYDTTYGYYVFKVPLKWTDDFDKIINMNLKGVSPEYISLLSDFYPKLASEGVFVKLFS